LGVKEFGLINSALVEEPTNLLGERIGDPDFMPIIAAGDFVGVYPRGRIFAVDLGTALYECSVEGDVIYDDIPPPFHSLPESLP
jgi:hypothetical protein